LSKDKSLLGICIPTYNRDYLIDACLNNLYPLAKKYNIPIFISDNASADNTQKIIKDYMVKYDKIFYFRQESNIGPDMNFEFILKQSSAKYSWLFGDSAMIQESELTQLLNDLSKEEYDVYVIGCKNRTEGIDGKIYTSHNELLSELGWHVTLLSCLIYNKSLLYRANFGRYYNTRFIQCGIIFECCSYQSFYIKFNPNIQLDIIKIKKLNSWSSIAFEVFCKDWFLYIMSLPCNYSFESKKKCIMDHGIKSRYFKLRNLLSLRGRNVFNFNTLIQYRYFIKSTIRYPMFVLIFICCIPKALYKLYTVLKYLVYK
jgi:glycosyltransferase involved in cell wall biosynthesis